MVAILVTPRSILMTRNALSKTCPLMKRAIECIPDFSNMVRKRAYSSSVNRTMTHFFAGSALRGLPGFPCLLREIRSSIVSIFAWRRRSPSVFNVDRYPAGYNDLVLPFCLCGGEGFGPVMFHKAKLPRGIIGCIRVRDANHCHTDANHCHGQNIAGSWGWNVYELSVEDMPERKSFFLGSLCLCNYSKNKLDKWSATYFSSTDSNGWSYLGVPISRFSSVFFAQKNGP